MKEIEQARKVSHEELLKATQYMEELEIRMFDANKRSLETLKMMRNAEVENV